MHTLWDTHNTLNVVANYKMSIFRPTYKLRIHLPANIDIEYQADKVRFIGSKTNLSNFAEEIRKVSKLKDGQLCRLDRLTLKVSDEITNDRNKELWIELPDHAWNIMASKFQDVVEEFENNPFDFNDCGYTNKIPFDIGIKIIDLPITE